MNGIGAVQDTKMKVYEELEARGLIAQVTDREEVRALVNGGGATFYVGFDATADSLHVGHFLQLVVMRHLQLAGNIPIALIGGGTTMVGDPSGRSDMRLIMTPEQIARNGERFKSQMGRFLDFSEGRAIFADNADWLLKLKYVDMLRDVGAHFSVNNMLRAECYKQRLEKGLSFLEFNYMIMQSYDFYALYKQYGCRLQCGGDDQWSNILGGTELIRRKTSENGKAGVDAYGMTFTLLLTGEGKKMGKTQSGAVWLDADKMSPFDFYQYWRNIDDADVIKCLRMLTFLPLAEISKMENWAGSQMNRAKESLAYELTEMVHGREAAEKARGTSRELFGAGRAAEDMPTVRLSADDLEAGAADIITLLAKAGLCASRSEARRAIEQGGAYACDEKVSGFELSFTAEQLSGDGIVLRRGKKKFCRVVLD